MRNIKLNFIRLLIINTLIACVLLMSACSSHKPKQTIPVANTTAKKVYEIKYHRGMQIAELAKAQLGKPYRYGGASPRGFDCSGLVYYTHNKFGISTPRTSFRQHQYAKPISLSSMQEGDLVFFNLNKKRVSHVGIYIGKNQFIHAPKAGKKVSTDSLNDPYWRSRIVGSGRLH